MGSLNRGPVLGQFQYWKGDARHRHGIQEFPPTGLHCRVGHMGEGLGFKYNTGRGSTITAQSCTYSVTLSHNKGKSLLHRHTHGIQRRHAHRLLAAARQAQAACFVFLFVQAGCMAQPLACLPQGPACVKKCQGLSHSVPLHQQGCRCFCACRLP